MAQTVKREIEIELNVFQVADLFNREFDGWCPVCQNKEINLGEVVCCDCLQQALSYHVNTCGCVKASPDPEEE